MNDILKDIKDAHENARPPDLCDRCMNIHRERRTPRNLKSFNIHELFNTRLVFDRVRMIARDDGITKHCMDLNYHYGVPFESTMALAVEYLVGENKQLREQLAKNVRYSVKVEGD